MATVTGLTKDRMIQIEEASIVNARKEGDNLILTTFGGHDINVGNVRGPKGDTGNAGFNIQRIADGTNLNDITVPGHYIQPNNVNALTSLNYPVQYAGLLEVGKDPLGTMTWQRYTTFPAAGASENTTFSRGFYNSVWYTWAQYSKVGHTHTTAEIISGVLDAARIPNLDTAKVTTGTFADARIPNLNASKTTAGTFDDARIPNLDGSKITTGAINIARLPIIYRTFNNVLGGVTIETQATYVIPWSVLAPVSDISQVINISLYNNGSSCPILCPAGISAAGIIIRNVHTASFTFQTNSNIRILSTV